MTYSNKKSGAPSTLEKAVAKESEDREAAALAQGTIVDGEGRGPSTNPPRRSVMRRIVGTLSLLLILAIVYIAWPIWAATLPGWMQAYLAPVMGLGRNTDIGSRIARLAAKIAPLEKEISDLKTYIAARPVADPGRLLALDDLVRQNGERLAVLKTETDTLSRELARGGGAKNVAALSKRLADVEQNLATFAARPSDTAAPGEAAVLNIRNAQRGKASERMSALELENVALRDVVAVLDRRVRTIENKPAIVSRTNRGSALLLAVGQLREAVRATAPFVVALQAVEALAGTQQALVNPISALKPHAKAGVPDLIALRLHFHRIAGRIAHESFVPKGDGWVDRTLGRVSRIFTFRRTGPTAASNDDENGRIARAELRLAAGDLGAVVTILAGLKNPGLAYAGPWLKEARARLVVDAAIKSLFSKALAQTRVPSDGKGSPGG
ncbi:mitofilin family membrane protein [Alphaproteobacteria bacterium]|nr:mitofilin family membrane protein [Alphaproteobacteria bacterium]